ncbi:hypothetical protein QA635_04195 [Bradyrhizobium brasilense]|uniref:hypothetical protein n=1 Tax=Bradyrhizobium brasilense TaxID=1419277 RepID=UPI0024B04829|nr:hypothetical protein [Bradyrhizobium australafricanum]WFU33656.1 hypothetical protein QA635_04195 [Bradyrhizobium australafricanum]
MSGNDQGDMLSGISDVSLMKFLLEDLHDDLLGKVQRFRYLHDLGEQNGRRTMLFGGHVTHNAWIEARSSFVHGNYVATVLLCQSLIENLLAAFLHGGLLDELPPRIQFDETLKRCKAAGILTDEEVKELKELVALRNPLTHFRNVDDDRNLDRRSIATGRYTSDILSKDAWCAITLASRMMGKPQFRLYDHPDSLRTKS